MNEFFTQYRLGYEYNGEILNYSTAVTNDLKTAQSWLAREMELFEDSDVHSFLVKETVKRTRI